MDCAFHITHFCGVGVGVNAERLSSLLRQYNAHVRVFTFEELRRGLCIGQCTVTGRRVGAVSERVDQFRSR